MKRFIFATICFALILNFKAKAQDYYNEAYRAQFHFSAPKGWLNDPSGLIYYNGEYHLFYQYNPHGTAWGLMHWGHAVSTDLVHWQNLPIALYPNQFGARWTGSSIVDTSNVTGLSKNNVNPMLMFYTARPLAATERTQRLAYSYDGRTFIDYPEAIVPYFSNGNRDPHIFWYAPTGKWVMVLYSNPSATHRVDFLTSTNLLNWQRVSSITGLLPANENHLFECNDFFELPVDNNPENKKWVLTGANGMYDVGTFDGTTFTPEERKLLGIGGPSLYASKTINNEPNGRLIDISWWKTNTHAVGMNFTQSMTLPVSLGLKSTPNGIRLTRTPIDELKNLRNIDYNFGAIILKQNDANPLANISQELLEIQAQFNTTETTIVSFNVRGLEISYNANTEILKVGTVEMNAPKFQSVVDLAIYVDRVGIEVFANGGLYYIPYAQNMDAANTSLALSVNEETAFTALNVYSLTRSWPNTQAPTTLNYASQYTLQTNADINIAPTLGGSPIVIPSVYQEVKKVVSTGGSGNLTGNQFSAKLSNPIDIAFDNTGNMYIAEDGNNCIKKLSADGNVTHFAGATNGLAGNVDGLGQDARFEEPVAIAVNPLTADVYVADGVNNNIRKITPEGLVTTFAGSIDKSSGNTIGAPLATRFSYPSGLAFDRDGNLYVSDRDNHRILKYSATTQTFTLLAGSTAGFADHTTATQAKFWRPIGLVVDDEYNVYVADRRNYRIRKITAAGQVTTIAGDGTNTSFLAGKGTEAKIVDPIGITIDNQRNLYVTDYSDFKIIKIDTAQNVTSFISSPEAGNTDGPQGHASIRSPFGVKLGPDNNIYFAERNNHNIKILTLNAYTITPKLPNGLYFDGLEGKIYGVASAASATKSYTVNLHNGYGAKIASNTFQLSVGSTLPVAKTTFTVNKTANFNAELRWNSTYDDKTVSYQIFKRNNGQSFSFLKSITATGNTNENYMFTDYNVQNGKTYYKLMAVNTNGEAEEIGIKLIDLNLNTTNWQIFPNPSAGKEITISIATPLQGMHKVMLFNSIGTCVYQERIKLGMQTKLSLQKQLPAGAYFLQIENLGSRKLLVF